MYYEFGCPQGHVTTIKRAMSDAGAEGPRCSQCHDSTSRVYGARDVVSQLDKVAYIDKAYRGEESVPGLTIGAIRAMVDTDVRHAQQGRRNDSAQSRRRRTSLDRRVGR